MDNLPDWVVSIIAVAVGLGPVLAILSARSIARLLHRACRRAQRSHVSCHAKSRSAFQGEASGRGIDRRGAR
jgi:pyruvate dehydrogenase complex dehydrogenase (E1) component